MTLDFFRLAATTLLSGGFINRQANPDLFEYLESPEGFEQIREYLSRLDLVPTKAGSGETWFAALLGIRPENRDAARATASHAKRELRHWVAFLKLAMSALDEAAPRAGALIHGHRLQQAVHENLNLQETLRLLSQRLRSQSEASIQTQLDSVLRWAQRSEAGLLEIVDESRSIYRLSGKVDWVLDMIQAFDEAVDHRSPSSAIEG